MKVEEFLLDTTLIKIFDNYIEDKENILKEVEFVIQKEVEKYG